MLIIDCYMSHDGDVTIWFAVVYHHVSSILSAIFIRTNLQEKFEDIKGIPNQQP